MADNEYYMASMSRLQLEQEVRELRQREGRLVRNIGKLRVQVQSLTNSKGCAFLRLMDGNEVVGYRQTVNQYWDVSKDDPRWSGDPIEYELGYFLAELPAGLDHGDRNVEGQEGRHLKRMGKPSNNPTGK
jgi:hypothetical protein